MARSSIRYVVIRVCQILVWSEVNHETTPIFTIAHILFSSKSETQNSTVNLQIVANKISIEIKAFLLRINVQR